MGPKKQRVVNKALLRKISIEDCCVCYAHGPSDPCHIKSKGSGGPDADFNVVPMCRLHHSEQHQIGILSFYQKYPMFRWALKQKGWTFEDGDLWSPNLDLNDFREDN